MPTPVSLTKSDVRRAMVRHHFDRSADLTEAFHRLRSVQFDPIAPVGCNHDLVLQARVPGYKVGDWEAYAYQDRAIYDGWDKMASLIPFEGWPVRRIFYTVHRRSFEQRIFTDHADAVETILKEIEAKGPMMPRDFEFQMRREEWKGSWFGPSVTKQTLRALWHSGLVMTTGRKRGQHIYDLTERVVPTELYRQPQVSDHEAARELVLERHRAMGLLRPAASGEVWSNQVLGYGKRGWISELVEMNELIPVNVEGQSTHATPEFLSHLDRDSIEPRVVFVGPLDPFMWDRKMIAHVFGFDYIWEIYTPEPKRKWGYYVLPILYGDQLVARAEFFARAGVLELRAWHFEDLEVGPGFWDAFEVAIKDFMVYCGAKKTESLPHIDTKVRKQFKSYKVK